MLFPGNSICTIGGPAGQLADGLPDRKVQTWTAASGHCMATSTLLRPFIKPASTPEQLLQKRKNCGLTVANDVEALACLPGVGAYRLKGYRHQLQDPLTKRFPAGYEFEDRPRDRLPVNRSSDRRDWTVRSQPEGDIGCRAAGLQRLPSFASKSRVHGPWREAVVDAPGRQPASMTGPRRLSDLSQILPRIATHRDVWSGSRAAAGGWAARGRPGRCPNACERRLLRA
jgi:hypothetical protein